MPAYAKPTAVLSAYLCVEVGKFVAKVGQLLTKSLAFFLRVGVVHILSCLTGTQLLQLSTVYSTAVRYFQVVKNIIIFFISNKYFTGNQHDK